MKRFDPLNRIFAILALFVVFAGGSMAYKFNEVKAMEAAGFLTTIVDATTTNKLIVNSDGSINTTPASGGSSAVTSIDGGIVTLGANADAAVGDATGTANAHLRQIAKTIVAGVPVTGTFWQATQPVSGTVAATQSGTWTVQPGNTANTTAWKVDGSAVTQPVSGTVTASNTAGDVAAGSSDSGNPVKVGAKAINAEITALSNAQRSNLLTDLVGKLIVLPYANPENFVVGVTSSDITGTGSTAVIAAQAAGVRTYITSITVTNLAAAVSTRVDILDGATVIWTGFAAQAGGGYSITFPTPLRGSTATAVNAQCATTSSQTRVAIAGYKGV